jgi:hypothetical protein
MPQGSPDAGAGLIDELRKWLAADQIDDNGERPKNSLRDQVIAPILAAVRSPSMGRKPAHWTRPDRDYERIRIDMQTLFNDLAIETPLAT